MAPARKKKRVQVVGSDLSSSEGHDLRSSHPIPPVSVLKDIPGSLPNVKPLPRTDETEHLDLRRKTYFVREDTSEENEPGIIHHDQEETSNTEDDKMRRLTYVVTPFPHGHAESPLKNCNPEIEMIHSELEIPGIQPPTLQDSKPKKRGEKKNSLPALQKSSKVMESERPDVQKLAALRTPERQKRMDDMHEQPGGQQRAAANESLVANAAGKPRRRAQNKSASSKDAQVKTLESENGTEISTVKAKGRKKKVQGQENENTPTGSLIQKKPAKKGKKKNAD